MRGHGAPPLFGWFSADIHRSCRVFDLVVLSLARVKFATDKGETVDGHKGDEATADTVLRSVLSCFGVVGTAVLSPKAQSQLVANQS